MPKSNIDKTIEKMASEMADKIVSEIEAVDYSKILKLLEAKTKKDAARIGKTLTIRKDQFSSLIFNAYINHTHGYTYKQYTKTHMATDLSEERLEQYIENQDFSKIIQKTFIERKHNCFHLFEKKTEWHLFYFDFGDVGGKHWKEGAHIHYISYLWEIDKNEVLKQVGNRKYKIGGIHIRTSFK